MFLTADPELPVPPATYGGIERVIAQLADALVDRGHDVVLFAHRASRTRAELVPYASRHSRSRTGTVRHALLIARQYAARRPCIIHSFGRLAYLVPVLPLAAPKIMSYQRPVTPSRVTWAHRLARGSLTFTGCSRSLIEPVRHIGSWRVLYNSVPVERFRFSDAASPDAPLVFLGRVEQLKGTDLAIAVARNAGRALVIAGTIAPEHKAYFDTEIAPHIDGRSVTYVGPVDDAAKSQLLSAAAALLMPVRWDEPFGIVMAEALACGTPVIGLRRGAVPEVIDDGATGFVCDTPAEMVERVANLGSIRREACRRAAEARFSTTALAETCEALYEQLVDPRPAGAESAAVTDGVRNG